MKSNLQSWIENKKKILSGIFFVLIFMVGLSANLGFAFPQITKGTPTPQTTDTATPLPISTPTIVPTVGTSESSPVVEKDLWDKASVVSQFFSGVIIAIVGLLITY